MATGETVFNWPCERHRNVPFKMLAGVPARARAVCPVCEPPDGRTTFERARDAILEVVRSTSGETRIRAVSALHEMSQAMRGSPAAVVAPAGGELLERVDVLRRAAERGLGQAHEAAPATVDAWQHVLDELAELRTRAEEGWA